MEVLKCSHLPHPTLSYCLTCGVYFSHSRHLFGLKTQRFRSIIPSNDTQQLSLIKSQLVTLKSTNNIFIPDDISKTVGEICQRHGWSLRTEAIGTYFYFYYLSKYPVKSLNSMFKYLVMCQYLASKNQQHNIPKGLKKFRKQCNKCFSLEQYVELQAEILHDFDFNFNICTFIDIMYCYLAQGVVFSNQRPNIQKIENKVLLLAKSYIRNGNYVSLDPCQLAAFIIYKARSESYCLEVWSWPIQEYTKIKLDQIKDICKKMLDINRESNRDKENCYLPVSHKRILSIYNGVY